MIRILLLALFFLMVMGDALGLNVGLAPGISVKNALLYLIVAGIAVETAVFRNRRPELLSVIAPFAVCFVYAAFSVAIVAVFFDYPGYSIVSSIISLKGNLADHVLMLLVFFYGPLTLRDSLSLLKAIIWMVLVVNVYTVLDVLNILNFGLIPEYKDGRMVGPLGEANQYAAFLALFLPVSLAAAFVEQGIRRFLLVIGILFSVLALLMTASRGGLVGVLGGAVIGSIFLRNYISGRAVLASFGGLLALAVVALPVLYLLGYGDLLYERFIQQSTTGDSFDVSSGRTYLWGLTFEKMLENPITLILGYGWATYASFPDFHLSPHNSYLLIYFEIGFVGLALVLLALTNTLRIARSSLQYTVGAVNPLLIGFVLGLLSLLISIFFVDLYSAWLFVWAISGVVLRLAVLQQEADASVPNKTVDNPDTRT